MSASAVAMPGNSLGAAGSAVMTVLHPRKAPASSATYLGNGLEAYASSRISTGAQATRMEKLLGAVTAGGGQTSATSSVSGASESDTPGEASSGGGELREEDIWATEARDWQQEGPKGLSFAKDERSGVRLISRQPRWMGTRERDLGLASWNDDSTVSKHRTTLLSPFRSYANASPQRIFGQQQSTGFRMIPVKADASQPMVQQSAPVNVPAWGRLAERDENGKLKRGEGDDSDDEGEGAIVPPHELIARQNAESGVVFSVYEGAGRTLKGRDAKKVRNAVLKQTGFFD